MPNSKEVKIYNSPEQVADAFALEFFHIISSSRQRFDIALSGGSTPKLLFEILAWNYSTKIPWDRIHFWWGDERCVPPIDNDSNFKLCNELLLSKLQIDESQIHRIKGELAPQDAANDYINQVYSNLNEREDWPIFDMIILGMGDDGHTASIFPHEIHLLNSDKICEVATHPKSGQKRITLTGKVLNNANRVFFLITGESKADRISEIMNNMNDADKLPASKIEPIIGNITFYLDEAAASKI